MTISDLRDARVGILGFGKEGAATLGALRRSGHKGHVCVLSDHATVVPSGAESLSGDQALTALRHLDILIRSPGFGANHPIRTIADALRVPQTTSTNLFLGELRAAGLPSIGITGSKGKSTTSTLAYLTLRQAGIPATLVGNIGIPALDELPNILENRLLPVLEMSSYQCDDLKEGLGPTIACLLDLFPEHLDWHGSRENYYRAKLRIALTQGAGDHFRYNASASFAVDGLALRCEAAPINQAQGLHFADGFFMRGHERLFDDSAMVLPGPHNRRNAIAALAVAELAGAKPQDLQSVLSTFAGLPFRLENEGLYGGVRWINDSLSTAPEAVAVAIEALAPTVRTLIAGGYDRGYDPTALLDAAKRFAVNTLILLPDTGAGIAAQARERQLDFELIEVDSLDEAVTEALKLTPKGATCLFSPGAPSYNRYRSFEERGAHLKALLKVADGK